MRVQATKKMVKELNKRAITNYCIQFFQLLEITVEQYQNYFIDSPLDHEEDYDYKTGLMKIIEVVYLPEMYSIPHYLTTKDLRREYRTGDTVETYMKRVINSVEI